MPAFEQRRRPIPAQPRSGDRRGSAWHVRPAAVYAPSTAERERRALPHAPALRALASPLWAVLPFLYGVPALGQTPEARDTLERWEAEVAAVADTAALRALEREWAQVAQHSRTDPVPHLRVGLLALRLGELTADKGEYESALDGFERADKLDPGLPWAHYGKGLAYLGLGEHFLIPWENLRALLRQDNFSKAVRALVRAVELDPSFTRAILNLAGASLRKPSKARLAVARAALEELRDRGEEDPALFLFLGRVDRELGDFELARAEFERYAEVGDRALASLEVARTLFRMGAPGAPGAPAEAVDRYWAGVDLLDTDSTAAQYYADLEIIVQPAEEEEWRSIDAHACREWLRRFWAVRDAAAGTRPGERLVEHYRRRQVALEKFRLVSLHRHYGAGDIVTSPRPYPFDDRGLVYIKHGEPDARAVFVHAGAEANETWAYDVGNERLVFHFVAREDVLDYRMVSSLLEALNIGSARTTASIQTAHPSSGAPSVARLNYLTMPEREMIGDLYASRGVIDPLYDRIALMIERDRSRDGRIDLRLVADEREKVLSSARLGLSADSHRLRFDSSIPFRYALWQFRDTTSAGDLYAVVAVPAERLRWGTRDDRTIYPVELTVTLVDSAGRYARGDSLFGFAASRPLGPEENVLAAMELRVPPGRYVARIVVRQPGLDAGGTYTREVEFGDLSEPGIGLSDLALAPPVEGRTIVRWGETVRLSPRRIFDRRAPARLYFELYGARAGGSYHVEIAARRVGKGGGILGGVLRAIGGLFGGGGPALSLTYERSAEAVSGNTLPFVQDLDLSNLNPGAYRLRVSVEDPATGAKAARELDLAVKE